MYIQVQNKKFYCWIIISLLLIAQWLRREKKAEFGINMEKLIYDI